MASVTEKVKSRAKSVQKTEEIVRAADLPLGRILPGDCIAAMDRRECTPITAIHVPGSGETHEQRDPDVPHGRVVAGLGHDLTMPSVRTLV